MSHHWMLWLRMNLFHCSAGLWILQQENSSRLNLERIKDVKTHAPPTMTLDLRFDPTVEVSMWGTILGGSGPSEEPKLHIFKRISHRLVTKMRFSSTKRWYRASRSFGLIILSMSRNLCSTIAISPRTRSTSCTRYSKIRFFISKRDMVTNISNEARTERKRRVWSDIYSMAVESKEGGVVAVVFTCEFWCKQMRKITQ